MFNSKIISTFTQDKYDKITWWTTEGYKSVIEDKPPYRIRKKRRDMSKTFFWQLWMVDEKRNLVEVLATGNKKKDLDIHIQNYFGWIWIPPQKQELCIINK